MRSLIRAFASRLNFLWILNYWPNIIWSLKGGCTYLSESTLVKSHIVGNHMSRLHYKESCTSFTQPGFALFVFYILILRLKIHQIYWKQKIKIKKQGLLVLSRLCLPLLHSKRQTFGVVAILSAIGWESKSCFVQTLICALETEINCCTIGLLLEHCTLSHKATVREIIPEFLNFELFPLF